MGRSNWPKFGFRRIIRGNRATGNHLNLDNSDPAPNDKELNVVFYFSDLFSPSKRGRLFLVEMRP